MQIRGGQFRKRISTPTPGTKVLVMPQFSYMPDQISGKIISLKDDRAFSLLPQDFSQFFGIMPPLVPVVKSLHKKWGSPKKFGRKWGSNF